MKKILFCLVLLAGCSTDKKFVTVEQMAKAKEYCALYDMGTIGWNSYSGFEPYNKAEEVWCANDRTAAYKIPEDKYK